MWVNIEDDSPSTSDRSVALPGAFLPFPRSILSDGSFCVSLMVFLSSSSRPQSFRASGSSYPSQSSPAAKASGVLLPLPTNAALQQGSHTEPGLVSDVNWEYPKDDTGTNIVDVLRETRAGSRWSTYGHMWGRVKSKDGCDLGPPICCKWSPEHGASHAG